MRGCTATNRAGPSTSTSGRSERSLRHTTRQGKCRSAQRSRGGSNRGRLRGQRGAAVFTPLNVRARGRWAEILPRLGLDRKFLSGKHGGCPVFGGGGGGGGCHNRG